MARRYVPCEADTDCEAAFLGAVAPPDAGVVRWGSWASDYVSGRRFRDAVAYAFYPVDLHDAATGIHPRQLAPGTVPTIPFRALCAKGVPRLLVAGRCVSSDRAANSGIRVQAACMATGQAAGEAAALAASRGLDPRDLPVGELRRLLARTGHIVPK